MDPETARMMELRRLGGEWEGRRFRGVAIVERPEALAQALVNGIGKGKAYGVGLLTVEDLAT